MATTNQLYNSTTTSGSYLEIALDDGKRRRLTEGYRHERAALDALYWALEIDGTPNNWRDNSDGPSI